MDPFHDRRDAGRQLARKLLPYAERDDVVVLALPRGGAPVAFEVAALLHAPLDLMLVRKLGVPGQEELALGAVAMPDIAVFNHDIVRMLALPDKVIDGIVAAEKKELQRRNRAYRHGEPPPVLKDRIVILVDDGMATGANMHAAVSAVAQQGPRRTIVAVPVASEHAFDMIRRQADEVVCLGMPKPFFSVGNFYEDFGQTDDEEVIRLLDDARHWGHGHIHFAGERRAGRS